jgi:hypothetical protein
MKRLTFFIGGVACAIYGLTRWAEAGFVLGSRFGPHRPGSEVIWFVLMGLGLVAHAVFGLSPSYKRGLVPESDLELPGAAVKREVSPVASPVSHTVRPSVAQRVRLALAAPVARLRGRNDLRVKVFDAAGQLARRATVSLRVEVDGSTAYIAEECTDSDGSCQFRRVPSGFARVDVAHENGTLRNNASATVVLAEGRHELPVHLNVDE